MTQREKDRLHDQHWSWLWTIIVNTGFGMILGVFVAVAILYFDMNRIGTMIEASRYRFGYTFLFLFGFASLFGMIASGTAIWFRATMEEE